MGQDAVKMLNEAIKRRGDLDVDVIAVLNDTTGKEYWCLVWKNKSCACLKIGG